LDYILGLVVDMLNLLTTLLLFFGGYLLIVKIEGWSSFFVKSRDKIVENGREAINIVINTGEQAANKTSILVKTFWATCIASVVGLSQWFSSTSKPFYDFFGKGGGMGKLFDAFNRTTKSVKESGVLQTFVDSMEKAQPVISSLSENVDSSDIVEGLSTLKGSGILASMSTALASLSVYFKKLSGQDVEVVTPEVPVGLPISETVAPEVPVGMDLFGLPISETVAPYLGVIIFVIGIGLYFFVKKNFGPDGASAPVDIGDLTKTIVGGGLPETQVTDAPTEVVSALVDVVTNS
jgi:hypothetical protein